MSRNPSTQRSALRAIQTKELRALFPFFGLEAREDLVDSHRDEISARFDVEVGEIVRRCSGLGEPEKFEVFRGALRLAYESALVHAPGTRGDHAA